jgi:uncharacterized OsmC-like protein
MNMPTTHHTTLADPDPFNGLDLATLAAWVDGPLCTSRTADTTVRASVTWSGGLRSQAQVREFSPIDSDEPSLLGGHDTAPSPVELLLAALGNCLAIGYAAHATAEGIAIRSLRVDLNGQMDLAGFLGLRAGHAGFDTVSATVHLDADADPETIQRLHDAVVATSRVGQTLQAAIPVLINAA